MKYVRFISVFLALLSCASAFCGDDRSELLQNSITCDDLERIAEGPGPAAAEVALATRLGLTELSNRMDQVKGGFSNDELKGLKKRLSNDDFKALMAALYDDQVLARIGEGFDGTKAYFRANYGVAYQAPEVVVDRQFQLISPETPGKRVRVLIRLNKELPDELWNYSSSEVRNNIVLIRTRVAFEVVNSEGARMVWLGGTGGFSNLLKSTEMNEYCPHFCSRND